MAEQHKRTSGKRVCPSCSKPIAANGLLGLCPECLLKSGFRTGTEPGTAWTPGAAFTPLSVAEVARLFPHLEILEFIGRGGMGAVYKARQPQLERLVALKLLPREADHESAFADRFAREARALARLGHPNIVSVYDFGQQEGLYYLIMEHVDGVNLRQLEHSRRLSPEEALAIVPSICEALEYAHRQGIVHRDIKPENILLDKQGRVKIADFGIAKILSSDGKSESLTGRTHRVGTPHYMAPEQVENPGAVDHRADIFSLGVVFYEMLTGELPLGKFAPPSQKVRLDVRLDEVVLRALEKEPTRRYQEAAEVKSQIDTIVTTAAPQWRETSMPNKPKHAPVMLLFIATAVLLCLLAWEWVLGEGTGRWPKSSPSRTRIATSPKEQWPAAPIPSTSIATWFARLEKPERYLSLRELVNIASQNEENRKQIVKIAADIVNDPSKNEQSRWQCCYVLAGIRASEGIPALVRALGDPNEKIRGCAACALGYFDHPSATAALERAARTEENLNVQKWIRQALEGKFRMYN